MGNAKNWLNFGSVRIQDKDEEYDIEFTEASGRIYYKPHYAYKRYSDNGTLKYRLDGFEIYIEMDEMYNIDSNDYTKYQNLARVLNSLVYVSTDTEDRYATITARYNDGADEKNVKYDCILTSDVSPQDIARINTGQVMALSWQANKRYNNIPDIVEGISDNYLVDENGDFLVDENGDYLTDTE